MAQHKPEAATRHQRWRAALDPWLVVASLIFLAAYTWRVLAQPAGLMLGITSAAIMATWLVFVADYVMDLILADNRKRWFWTHLYKIAIILIPPLRPIWLLRLVAVLNRATGAALRGRIVAIAAVAALLVLWVSALAVLEAERYAPGASITTLGDAVWWAMVTITTVGYGDLYPITVQGRVAATVLMLSGLVLLGVITATLSSYVIERARHAGQEPPEDDAGW
ncbi:potassium channel family protein [Arthrobacter ginkgonis]|uniref:Potassium channel family protein n=1 Tax=Arthrobacter ginkgonis TaxID=1630594 RepID=A0ABP7BT13_9MICC